MWITTAWQHISPAGTVKGVMYCCTPNGMDGTNDYGCGMAQEGRWEC